MSGEARLQYTHDQAICAAMAVRFSADCGRSAGGPPLNLKRPPDRLGHLALLAQLALDFASLTARAYAHKCGKIQRLRRFCGKIGSTNGTQGIRRATHSMRPYAESCSMATVAFFGRFIQKAADYSGRLRNSVKSTTELLSIGGIQNRAS